MFFHKKTILLDAFRWSGLSSLGFRDLKKKNFRAKFTDGEKSVTAKISDANLSTVLQSSLIKFEDIINVAMVMIFRHELTSVDCKGHAIRGYIML